MPALVKAPTPAGVEVVRLGRAAFKITTPGGKVIVTDPWLRTNPLTPAAYKQLESFRIHHAGDIGVFGDMKLIGERYKPDLALMPIGGNFTMDPADAAWAVKDLLRPKAVVPMHYGANPLANGTAAQFSSAMGASAIKVILAAPGQSLSF